MTAAHIVILSQAVGGAEKRFAENFLALRSQGRPVRLIVSETVRNLLMDQSGLEGLSDQADHVVGFRTESRRYSDMARAASLILRDVPAGDVVHFPLAFIPGQGRAKGRRLIISWVNVRLPRSLAPAKLKSTVMPWASFIEADVIDILNPDNLARIQRVPLISRKARLTRGGTFVNFHVYRPAPQKEHLVVFLGRVEPEKNGMAFARLIPQIVAGLKARGVAVPALHIAGVGVDAQAVAELVKTDAYRGLDIRLGYAARPHELLARAKVFLSLQRTSNYPSKALAEAMACGCFPVITEIGESRLMADDSIAAFVDRDLDAGQMIDALARPLSLADAAFGALSEQVVQAARAKFRVEVQAAYFAELYGF